MTQRDTEGRYTMQKYTVKLDGGEGGSTTIQAASLTDAWEQATDWALGGDWCGHLEPGDIARDVYSLVGLTSTDPRGPIDDDRTVCVFSADDAAALIEPLCEGEPGAAHDWGDESSRYRNSAWEHSRTCARCGVKRAHHTEQGQDSVWFK